MDGPSPRRTVQDVSESVTADSRIRRVKVFAVALVAAASSTIGASAQAVDAWVPVASQCRSAVLMDPMTAATGVAPMRVRSGRTEVYLQMQPGETRVLRAFADTAVEGPGWPITEPSGEAIQVEGHLGRFELLLDTQKEYVNCGQMLKY